MLLFSSLWSGCTGAQVLPAWKLSPSPGWKVPPRATPSESQAKLCLKLASDLRPDCQNSYLDLGSITFRRRRSGGAPICAPTTEVSSGLPRCLRSESAAGSPIEPTRQLAVLRTSRLEAFTRRIYAVENNAVEALGLALRLALPGFWLLSRQPIGTTTAYHHTACAQSSHTVRFRTLRCLALTHRAAS